jgi:hypothetical protein
MNAINEITRAGKVALPNEYFAKSKLEYSDWRWALFRELIQNSYDAKASRIDFEIGLIENRGTIYIECSDNGAGMTEDVLVNKLLSMGGSYKPEGGIGGFGYAKVLLYFAHRSYRIRTQDQLVEGNGGDYTITHCKQWKEGTTSVVELDLEGWTVEEWISRLHRFASFMALQRSCMITVNGVELKAQFEDFEYAVPTSLGMFSFKETQGGTSNVIVSVRGLPMFVQRVYGTGSTGFVGVLELEGDTREILTSNRDALRGMYANHLNQLIQKMVDDRHTFKRGTTVDITLNFTAPLVLDSEKRETASNGEQGLGIAGGKYETLEEELRYMVNDAFPKNFNLRIQNTVGRGGKDREDGTVSVAQVLSTLRKGWVQSLAFAWKVAVYGTLFSEFGKQCGCQWVFDNGVVLDKFGPGQSVADIDFEKGAFYRHGKRIVTGFVFAKETEGLNVKQSSDGSDILVLCNPQSFDKSFLVGDLLDLAIHENSHLLVSGHNEEFVDVDMKFRRSFRRVMNEQELKILVKSAIAAHKA